MFVGFNVFLRMGFHTTTHNGDPERRANRNYKLHKAKLMWKPPESPGSCFDLHFDRFDGREVFRTRVRKKSSVWCPGVNQVELVLRTLFAQPSPTAAQFRLPEVLKRVRLDSLVFLALLRVQKRTSKASFWRYFL